MTHRLFALVACALTFACDADRPTTPLRSPTVAKAEAPELRAAPTTTAGPSRALEAPTPATTPKDVIAELAATPHPSLVGPFAALTLTQSTTVRDARSQAPQLFANRREGALTGPYAFTAKEWPDQLFEVAPLGQIDSDLDQWLVGSLRVIRRAEGAEQALVAAWGDPKTDGSAKVWLAPELGLRADLHRPHGVDASRIAITLRGYTPLATLIGTDAALFGFEEGAPILGAKGSELVRRFGRRIMDYDKIRLWPIENGGPIDLWFAAPFELDEASLPDHLVTGFALELGNDQAVSALLEKKLGKPTIDRDDDRIRVYRKSPRVTFDGNELVVGEKLDGYSATAP